MEIRIGCCGLARLGLTKYGEHFDTLEINSTFYKLPKKSTAEKWFQQTSGKIRFTLKAFQGVTHSTESNLEKSRYSKAPKKPSSLWALEAYKREY